MHPCKRPPLLLFSIFATIAASSPAFGWHPVACDGSKDEIRGEYAIPDRSVYESFGEHLRGEPWFADKPGETVCFWSDSAGSDSGWIVFAETNAVRDSSGRHGFLTYVHRTNGWFRAEGPVRTALGFVPDHFTATFSELQRVWLKPGKSAVMKQNGCHDVFWEEFLDPRLLKRLGDNPSYVSRLELVTSAAELGLPEPLPSIYNRNHYRDIDGFGFGGFVSPHRWCYLSAAQQKAEEERIAKAKPGLPPPVPDPSEKPVRVFGDEKRPYGERWRILADLDFDGVEDMILSEEQTEFGTGGGGFSVFIRDGERYQKIGETFLHPACIQIEDVHWHAFDDERDGVRLWSYWHLSGSSGSLHSIRIGRYGTSGEESIMIFPGDGGNAIGNGIFDAVFETPPEIPFRVQHSEPSPDGVVTWKDLDDE